MGDKMRKSMMFCDGCNRELISEEGWQGIVFEYESLHYNMDFCSKKCGIKMFEKFLKEIMDRIMGRKKS